MSNDLFLSITVIATHHTVGHLAGRGAHRTTNFLLSSLIGVDVPKHMTFPEYNSVAAFKSQFIFRPFTVYIAHGFVATWF